MTIEAYKKLANRLDTLPNGFPPTSDGVELRILAKLFSADEALLVSNLRLTRETPRQIAERVGGDENQIYNMLKGLARRGLINAGRTDEGLGFSIMPFVVGIYEMQVGNLDEEFALLFENYYKQAFATAVEVQPTFHRVIPVNKTVRMDIELKPYESALDIVSNAKAWGILDCICRKQKELVGDPCEHPVDVCMALGKTPGVFDTSETIKAVSLEEAQATLYRAAEAGLVHSVSNTQQDLRYICNCCTCSCGILRGIADFGIANVIARSAFVNTVDDDLCIACEDCLDYCQFSALSLEDIAVVDTHRCVGCGVCVPNCPEEAMYLLRRPIEEDIPPPATHKDWLYDRANARNINLRSIL